MTRPRAATNRDDVIAATADGVTLRGLGGNDRLTSNFNATRLFGDAGRDELSTVVAVTDPDSTTATTASQNGGTGNDRLTIGISSAGAGPIEATVDGGSGNDRIGIGFDIGLDSTPGVIQRATATADGGRGNDSISVSAYVGVNGGEAVLRASGGDGDDRIVASVESAHTGDAIVAITRLDGGRGDDTIHVNAIVSSNSGRSATSIVEGGTGDDVIRNVAYVSSNSGLASAVSRIDAGAGDDSVTIRSTGNDNNFTTVRDTALGGSGDDDLMAILEDRPSYALNGRIRLDGGDGADSLRVEATVALGGASDQETTKLVADLRGGEGRDTIVSRLDVASYLGTEPTGPTVVENRLSGGAGRDVLTSEIVNAGAGFLAGGDGNDVLRVIGGTGNQLDGGAGRDRLIASDNDDILAGGTGADQFDFGIVVGDHTITDFDASEDVLVLALYGPNPIGGPVTVRDEGAGLDVIVDFFLGGGSITFEGAGTGSVSSLYGLVDDPSTQLIV